MGMGRGVDMVNIMEVFCLGLPRGLASFFCVVRGGAFDLRSGWNFELLFLVHVISDTTR